jgi:hypothetical protein
MRQTRQAVRAINKSIFLICLWFMLSHIFIVTLSVALFSADMLSVVYAECHIFIVIQSVICAERCGTLNSPAKTCLDILTSSKKNLMRSSLTARGIFPTVRMRELFGLWRSPTILYSFIWCQCYKILSGITVAGKSY